MASIPTPGESDRFERPIASYTKEDVLGEHEIVVSNGTRRANEYLVGEWQDTRDVLVREALSYLHDRRDHLPLDVWRSILVDSPLVAVCAVRLGTVRVGEHPESIPVLDHTEQDILQNASDIVVYHQEDLDDE